MKRYFFTSLIALALAASTLAGRGDAAKKIQQYRDYTATLQSGASAQDVLTALGEPFEKMIRNAGPGRREEMWLYPTSDKDAIGLIFANGTLASTRNMPKAYPWIPEGKLSEKEAAKRAKLTAVDFGATQATVEALAVPDARTVLSSNAPKTEAWYYIAGNTMTIVMFKEGVVDGIVARRVTNDAASQLRRHDIPRAGTGMDSTNPGVPDTLGGRNGG